MTPMVAASVAITGASVAGDTQWPGKRSRRQLGCPGRATFAATPDVAAKVQGHGALPHPWMDVLSASLTDPRRG
jgi:hypothetical protein